MRGLIAAVIVVALAWAGWWVVGSRMALRGAEGALAALSTHGLEGQAQVSVAGFPNRFDLTFDGLELADPQRGLAWKTPFAMVYAMAWKPWHLIAALPSGQEIVTPYQRFTLEGEPIRASIEMRPGADLALTRLAVQSTGGRLASDMGWQIGWTGAQLATRRQASDYVHELGLKLEAVTLPRLLPGLPDEIAFAEGLAVLTFEAPLDRHLTSVPAVIVVDLREARLIWGPVKLFAKGAIEADAAGRAEGKIALRVEGWRAAWSALRYATRLPPLVQGGIGAMLKNLSSQSADPEILDLELVMEGGAMRLGAMLLGPAPRLR